MLKKQTLLFILIASVFVLSACKATTQGGGTTQQATPQEQTLVVYFVPSREASAILEATQPLKQMLKTELNSRGFNFTNVDIRVGTTYEAVVEALSAGTADVGFIPGGTYASMNPGEGKVILTATRFGLNKDSENPKDWNDGNPTTDTTEQVTYYRSIIIAGPSTKGKALATKVNNGQALVWDDIKDAVFCHGSPTSSASYIYPTLWLYEKFGKTLADLPNATRTQGYPDTLNQLALETCDLGAFYADYRRDGEQKWKDAGRTNVWTETNVIGVTKGIYNDTITVTLNNDKMTPQLQTALQEAFIAIANTDAGKNVIKIYNHLGYKVAQDSDYDNERAAQDFIRSQQ